ncbi:MAG: gfo/Idh/MocA family oxidoreductase [Chloroflexi bacterium]|nr:MAG: gfo/Idh/MocA family oxidoreductase [Chloroflexota bacterium]MBL1196474.1 gfo/Idh/MocA family oxidoreductase [Chloroflexota bacterium]NOH13769.1 Gfo/Idh/MocA family oxidoreductase [Chloroflexota bacterium]
MMKTLNVAIIGTKFMGKAHSNAWLNSPRFFDMGIKPVMKLACGQNEEELKAFAETWGWEETETDWKKVIENDDIDIVDISVPTYLHHEMAVAAAKAGKHIFCEKPFALTTAEAKEMYEEAEKAGIVHYLNHNYRRAPAVRLAKKLIEEDFVGRIFHWRGAYLQDWIVDPEFPLTWHLRADRAGAGPHYDLNSHSVDLARYLVGEINSISALTTTFIKERPLPGAGAATFSAGSGEATEMGEVTVDDASFMLAEFENGAIGSFEASRFAPGRKNFNYFEIYGSKGSIVFNLERMNELQLFQRDDPAFAQGFRTILATEAGEHDYIANWWPPGHMIGYEHEFHHGVVDFMEAIEKGTKIEPSFYDGLREIEILEAGLQSSAKGEKVDTTPSK